MNPALTGLALSLARSTIGFTACATDTHDFVIGDEGLPIG